MNYFIGCKLADHALGYLLQTLINRVDPSISKDWVANANMHFTIFYIGKLHSKQLEQLISCIKKLRFERTLNVAIQKGHIFLTKNHLTAVLLLESVNNLLLNLHNSFKQTVTELFSDHKVQSFREFKPHITLGRFNFKSEEHMASVNKAMNFISCEMVGKHFSVTEAALLHYDISVKQYKADCKIKLGGY